MNLQCCFKRRISARIERFVNMFLFSSIFLTSEYWKCQLLCYAYPLLVAWIWHGALIWSFETKKKKLHQKPYFQNQINAGLIRSRWLITGVLFGVEIRLLIAPCGLTLLCIVVQLFPVDMKKLSLLGFLHLKNKQKDELTTFFCLRSQQASQSKQTKAAGVIHY